MPLGNLVAPRWIITSQVRSASLEPWKGVVSNTMYMSSPPLIVPRKVRIKHGDTIRVGELDASEGSGIDHGPIISCIEIWTAIEIPHATVDARGVTPPDINGRVGHRSASLGVNDLDVEGHGDAALVVSYVSANLLALNICGHSSHVSANVSCKIDMYLLT